MAYGARLCARAVADTKLHWTPVRTLVQLASPVFVGVLWTIFKPWGGWWLIAQVTLISVIGFFALWGLVFFVNLALAPGRIDAEQQTRLTALTAELGKKSERTPSEEQKYAEAKAALDKLGSDGIAALRLLEKRETITFSDGPITTPVPTGMTRAELRAILDRCVSEFLVTSEIVQKTSGGAYPAYDYVYKIAPGMKATLLELLYAPQ